MTRKKFKKITECYVANGDFVGNFISETQLDEISRKLKIADEEGNYISEKIEEMFNVELHYVSDNNASFGECEIIF